MENKDSNLRNAFQYIKTFYRELAQMLEDIDELMDKESWSSMGGSGVTSDMSKSLDNPNIWSPYYLYRNYSNEEEANYKKGILIFFDTELNDFPISVVYGNINITNQEFNKWDMWNLWNDNMDKLKSLTGEVIQVKATSQDGKNIDGKLIAIPLTMISTKEDLKEKVVDKLLNLK